MSVLSSSTDNRLYLPAVCGKHELLLGYSNHYNLSFPLPPVSKRNWFSLIITICDTYIILSRPSLVPRPSASRTRIAYVTFEPLSDKLARVQRSHMRCARDWQTAWEQD